ncbi:MAG TPA: helicase HerA-like domain-containing protein [Sphingomonas sp.]|nr:helicase HerA-like domain-containing protein [Sphingomonas sp.]
MADDSDGIFIGATADGERETLVYRRANRHGLIAGATGTGKTVTLQGIAEDFSRAGVPVFVADVKGDLSGLAMAGSPTAPTNAPFAARAKAIGYADWAYADNPVEFWDLLGEQGHPVRTTVTEMGPLLLARLMELNEVQEGVLTVAFTLADKEGLLLLDLDDLQAMLNEISGRADELAATYGNVSKASVGAIQRALLQLRSQGGEHFFGEPALDIHDLLRTDEKGRGIVNILAADKLMAAPKLYATFLLWMLSELFEALPEVGDPPKPKLVFFFDEAHLLFDEAPPALIQKVEQVVRLIRSKGVGVYFITQNPVDVPETVAGQLGNRVQHAIHAFTPKDQKAVKAAAETFRANPGVDVAKAIIELKVGEALVSLLQDDGSPAPVTRTLIKPPRSRVGPITPEERGIILSASPLGAKYDTPLNRESAAEKLAAKAQAAAAQSQEEAEARAARRPAPAARPSTFDKMMQSAARSASSSIGRQVANAVGREIFGGGRRSSGGLAGQLVRGVLGGLMRNLR